ncbi:MAG: class Ib ribonucleoside-diphosphate reductase assembly flavoprotein NrdI [Acholeplasmataceae bacterium]
MVIVYDSLTGQSKRFAHKLNLDTFDINLYQRMNEDVLLVTRTFNFGEIPESTIKFLDQFRNIVKGVCVSGNKNWGSNYGAAGDKIEKIYHIPLVLKFEASGFDKDVDIVKSWIDKQNNKGDINYVNV